MKITLLTPFIDTRGGGVSEVVLDLAANFVARGLETHVLGKTSPEQLSAVTTRVPTAEAHSTAKSVARAISAKPRDILHVHGLWDPYLTAGQIAARRLDVPIVVSPHGMLDAWALAQGRLKKKIALATYEGRNLARAACIHALTTEEADAVRALIPGAPVAIIPNGVNLPLIRKRTEVENKTLLFLGRIHPKKGILDLIEGFARVPPGGADGWQLVIAGWDDGGHAAEVRARIAALGLGHRVSMLGPVFGEEKSRLMASATAFALTSYSEGLPMTILEAWSHALPVLMTPECNLTIGCPAGAAVLCDIGSEPVARGLAKLFAMSPAARVSMGAAGRALVEDRFSWAEVTQQLEALYAWLCGTAEKPNFIIHDS
jgi:glycosyltransferase involved in cell wall biosynthesis